MDFPFCETTPTTIVEETNSPSTTTIGSGQCLEFIEQCLKTVSLGKRADFRVFPNNPNFEWILKLNDIKKTKDEIKKLEEDKATGFIKIELEVCKIEQGSLSSNWELSISEKYSQASQIKSEGDDFFRKNEIEQAKDKYFSALKMVYCDSGESFDDLRKKIAMNLAFVYHKLGMYKDSIRLGESILEEFDDGIFKVHYRKGMSEMAIGKYEEALKTWTQAQYFASSTEIEDCKKKVVQVKQKIKAKEERRRSKLSKMFQ